MLDLLGLLFSINTSTVNSRLAAASCASPCLSQEVSKSRSTLPASPLLIAAETDSMPLAAKVLPDNLLGLVFIDTNASNWSQLSTFDPFGINIAQTIDLLFRLNSNITFTQDVQPWLSDRIAIAFLVGQNLPKLKNHEKFPNPLEMSSLNIVAIAPTSDQDKSNNFLEKLQKITSRSVMTEEYKGVKLILLSPLAAPQKTTSDMEPPTESDDNFPMSFFGLNRRNMAIASLPGYLAVSPNLESLKLLIDGKEQPQTLADNLLFQRTLKHPNWKDSLISGYGNYKLVTNALAENLAAFKEAGKESEIINSETIEALQNTAKEFDSFDFYIWSQPDGIRSQAMSYYITPNLKNLATPITSTHQILGRFPADALSSISSRRLNDQWQWLVAESDKQPSLKIITDGIRIFTPQITGLDLEKDIVPWMNGEYGIVLFPSDRGLFQDFGVNLGIGLIVQTSDRFAANRAMAKLEKFFSSQSGDSLGRSQRRVVDKEFTSWEVVDSDNKAVSKSVFAYGWADRQTLIITSGIGPMSALYPKPTSSLAQAPIFQSTIKDIPTSNFGYFFVNNSSWVKLIYSSFTTEEDKNTIPPAVKAGLDKLGGMAIVYSATPEKLQSDLFLGIQPNNSKKP